jgi:hypothetical protein
MDHNIYRWAASILGDLHELRMESPGLPEVAHARPVTAQPVELQNRRLA